ncbi:hypothetical protein RAB80_005579 [Fusarium oxysporum f. sp. vasinfectum]|nr:hypothetical protein RAB80_005579 [Fusarium oxysporum f. sp. vasinfectum]
MASLHNPPSQPTTSDQAMTDSDTITSAWSLARDEQQPPQQPPQRDKQPKTPKRVCTACRRRKVGCDKKQPCQNCKKAGNDCVYPPSNDANAHQMIRDERLLEQLNRLEPMFKTLASYADRGMLPAVVGSILPEAANNNHSSPTPPTPQHSAGSGSARDRPVYRPVGTQQTATQQTPSPPGQHSQPQGSKLTGGEGQSKSSKGKGTPGSAWSSLGTSTGKLVKDDGRHRYVSGTFWESLHNEAWKLFKENVHPLATILHVPSVEPLVLQAMQNTQNLAPRIEGLLFVIYFGAVNSLSPDDCELQFWSPQSALLVGFRRGVDSALARSRMMETDDMLILQTFVVYLVILRSVDPTYSWNMTGLAVRLAQALGMHRDGRLLNLSPFDAEMRRRLWWGICILDTPASEEYSGSTGVLELSSFDSRPPLNVNDSDLHPDMTDDPAESQDLTDMSFTVARCWASNVWRTMIDTRRADPDSEKSFQLMTLAERQSWVDRKSQEISGQFSGDTNSRKSLHLLLSSFTGTIIKNLRFLSLNPLEPGSQLDDDQRKRVLQDAIEFGAGFGGLAAAIELADRGFEVTVLEKYPDSSSQGDILDFFPNAGCIIHRWDDGKVGQEIHDTGCSLIQTMELCKYDGKLITNVPWARGSVEHNLTYAGHRGKIHSIILSYAKTLVQDIRIGVAVTDYLEEEDRAGVLISTGETLWADCVIAADGPRSIARQKVLKLDDQAKDGNKSGWSVFRSFFKTNEAMLKHPGLKDLYHKDRDVLRVWMYDNLTLLAVVWNQGKDIAWVLIHPDDKESSESWSNVAEREHVAKWMKVFTAEDAQALFEVTPVGKTIDFKLVYRPTIDNWVSEGGRTILIGDAAHANLPTAGQGASQALEDAVTVAQCMEMSGGDNGQTQRDAFYKIPWDDIEAAPEEWANRRFRKLKPWDPLQFAKEQFPKVAEDIKNGVKGHLDTVAVLPPKGGYW